MSGMMTSSVRTPWKSQRFRIGSSSEENISLMYEAAKSTVLDRELEHEKSHVSGPRIRCPHLHQWTVNPVLFVWPMVAPFRIAMQHKFGAVSSRCRRLTGKGQRWPNTCICHEALGIDCSSRSESGHRNRRLAGYRR